MSKFRHPLPMVINTTIMNMYYSEIVESGDLLINNGDLGGSGDHDIVHIRSLQCTVAIICYSRVN